jgi:tRNA pseudouridine65 synthase
MALHILYRDAHLLALHKPAGLLVHRSPISRDSEFLLQRLRDQIGQRVYPVHRLDRATSGLILFGLSPEAAQRLVSLFEQRQVEKSYLALCRGWLADSGQIDHPLRDEEGNNQLQAAQTQYRCLRRVELPVAVDRYASSRYSLAQISPHTGRRQQIRKHFKHISHHLIGDTSHGNGRHNRFFRETYGINRLLLTSWRLALIHPYTGERLRLQTPLEEEWLRLFAAFGWERQSL